MSTNLLQQECRLQIACTWQNFLSCLPVTYIISNNLISWEIWCNNFKSTWNFSKDYKLHWPYTGSCNVVVFETFSCANINIKLQSKSPYYLNILKSSWSEINDHMYIIINIISTCIVFLMLWGFISQFFSRRPVLLVEYAVVDNL